jgi:hypothetical protein
MTIHQPANPAPEPADKLDELLTNHLSVTLEPQRGRALAAFRAQLGDAPQHTPQPIPISRGLVPRRALWYWAGVPSLVAAGLAVVVTLQTVNRPAPVPGPAAQGTGDSTAVNIPAGPTASVAAPAPGTLVFDQYVTSQDINGGVAVLDGGTPVRVVRQLETRHTQWVDPKDRAVYSLTEEPVEKVGYLKIQPN